MIERSFVELGSVAEFVNGAAFKPSDWDASGTQIIRIQNLTDPTKPFNRTNRPVPAKLRVVPGDLLVSWSATLGVYEWSGPAEAVVNQHIFRVLPNEARIDRRYLRHALEGALREMGRHLHGATMKHVNRGAFLSTPLFLPSLAQQRRIADILDRADCLRVSRRSALAHLSRLKWSIFCDLFGDPFHNPMGWPTRPLAGICTEISDIDHNMPKATDDGVALISAKDLLDDGRISFASVKYISTVDFHRLSRKSRPQRGDIIYSRIGTVGKARLVDFDRDFLASYSCCVIRPNSALVDTTFLCRLLDSPALLAQATQGVRAIGVPDLGLSMIRAFIIMLPPLTLQRKYAQQVDVVEQLEAQSRLSLALLEALFASLQTRALRGEL